ncbi:RNA polymerase subunit sigma-70 [Flavonifractor sp. An92]|uniref:RNA polymerase sigma factor n=1 Tax=Flavonifractor sp. An92 TaxID=1965666 RepID=UPI000B36EA3F|nr:sigma-70 family RNA polymerase sigma factor [Flavonifractor sp. An92]OUN06146.1 RNA polymerase subunit sigma-70 [Flavonifractor sp. An92]
MDEKRAEDLVKRHADTILRIGYTWLGDLDDAKDVCQEVLIRLLEDGRTFPDPGQERAWVVRVTINACKNWKKSAWFRRRAPLEEGLHLSVENPEPEDGSLLAEVNRLPGKYREVLYLRYYEEYQVGEIAEILGQSPALVSTHLARAKAKLRKRLEGTCYG